MRMQRSLNDRVKEEALRDRRSLAAQRIILIEEALARREAERAPQEKSANKK